MKSNENVTVFYQCLPTRFLSEGILPEGPSSFVQADEFGAVRCHFPSLAHLLSARMSACLSQPAAAATFVTSSGETLTHNRDCVFTSAAVDPSVSCAPLSSSSVCRLQTSLLITKYARWATNTGVHRSNTTVWGPHGCASNRVARKVSIVSKLITLPCLLHRLPRTSYAKRCYLQVLWAM